jgi:hypothetical protein
MAIRPQGFDSTHARGGAMHRLRDRADKWQPFMVGETVDMQTSNGPALAEPGDGDVGTG